MRRSEGKFGIQDIAPAMIRRGSAEGIIPGLYPNVNKILKFDSEFSWFMAVGSADLIIVRGRRDLAIQFSPAVYSQQKCQV